MDQYTEAAAARPTDQDHGFQYSGGTGGILLLTIKNALLNIITLTIYRFWAKTHVRRHLWRHTLFHGDQLEYTGVGKELFLGFLLVLFVVIFPLAIVNSIIKSTIGPVSTLQLTLFALVLFLLGVAQYRARRYRLSRTVWRGIRAAQTGSPWIYGLKRLGFTILLILSLGWSYPWQRIHIAHFEMNNTWFGDRTFTFKGKIGSLYNTFAIAWLISLVALVLIYLTVSPFIEVFFDPYFSTNEDLGSMIETAILIAATGYAALLLYLPVGLFIIVWYRIREFAYMAGCTGYEAIKFDFNCQYWKLFRLVIGNYFITVFTLGFGLPIVQTRKFQFFCAHIKVHGSAEFDAIRQSTEERDKLGEGLADAFDIGDF